MNNRLLMEVPAYRRARGYRIYGEKGQRFLDFYQDDGHALLGHRHSGLVLEMKSLLSRGQVAPYPSRYLALTIKAVVELIPGAVEVRIYRSIERAIAAAGSHLKRPLARFDIGDPALPGSYSGDIVLWRPFLESETIDSPLLLPVLPFSTPPGPAVLVFREKPAKDVPPSEDCSPLSLAALKKSIFELIRYREEFDRSRWPEFESPSIWSRKGPYLTLKIEEAEFVPLFREMLENGILLSPRYPGPSIIPGEFSPGELARLQQTLRGGVG
jgi:hypothetical protein